MEGTRIKLRITTSWSIDAWLLAFILATALISRLYSLESFPYYPPEWPWLGDNPKYKGLYRDEANYMEAAIALPFSPTPYQPWLQLSVVRLFTLLLGPSTLAARLPSSLASALTAPIIYLAAKELFHSRAAALIASFYYIAMVPGLIYGRMLLLENFAAFFIALEFYFLIRYLNLSSSKLLYIASALAASASMSKVTGVVGPALLTLALLAERRVKGNMGPLFMAWFPLIAFVIASFMIRGSLILSLRSWSLGYVGRELSWQFLFLQALPSGHILFSGGYVKPEFWYLYAYLSMAVLALVKRMEAAILIYPLTAFFTIPLAVWGFSAYYPVLIYPMLALAAGGGTILFLRISNILSLGLFSALYVPLVASVIASLSLPVIDYNYWLFFLKLGILLAPLALWTVVNQTLHLIRAMIRLNFPFVLLISYFALLLSATHYLYPYFFLGRA
jgi:4-amino-4-deoxy-L-arabinose transferase-like glycosyltransferase